MRTLLNWLEGGGPFIVPLLVTGGVGMGVLVERLAAFVKRSRINSRPFIERVISLVGSGKADEALALCVDHSAALPDLGLVLLRSRISEPETLHAIARAAKLALVSDLDRRAAWVPAIVVIVVLLGLGGAAVNLHDALAGSPEASMLAALAYASRPFAAAMLITVPLVAGHAYVVEARARLSSRMEEFSARLVNAMSGRPDVRLGHRD